MRRFLLLAACLAAASPAQAYLDPNAGGLLFQILAPALIALAAAWHWIRRAVSMALSRVGRWLGKP